MDLAAFVQWAVQAAFEGGDLNGGEIQDKAVELGILDQTKYDPMIHGAGAYCDAAPGCDWYVYSDAFKKALKL